MPTSLDPTFPLFPVMSFLGFVVALIPLPWHFQAWNSGTCAFMIWTSLGCLVEFIDSLIWKGSLENNIPVWCDISTKFLLGAGVGIPASTLCISRRLYSITAVQSVSVSYADKRRAVIIDLCIAVGLPAFVMALHYIVQPHRYNILEDIGCVAAVYNTLPAYFLVLMWPVLIGSISFVYSALTFRAFWRRRLQLAQLVSTNAALSMSRYIRLMMLSVTDMLLTLPIGIFTIWLSLAVGGHLEPWISWEDTHFNFSRVVIIPSLIWRSDSRLATGNELARWLYPASAFIFFALFGFAEEAQKNYKKFFCRCVKPFGFTPSPTKTALPSSLPSWIKPGSAKESKTSPPSQPIYISTPIVPSSTKGSRLSLTSTSDATIPGDFDVEKLKGPHSPSIDPCPTYTYPPLSPSLTVVSPSASSVSCPDLHWPPSPV